MNYINLPTGVNLSWIVSAHVSGKSTFNVTSQWRCESTLCRMKNVAVSIIATWHFGELFYISLVTAELIITVDL